MVKGLLVLERLVAAMPRFSALPCQARTCPLMTPPAWQFSGSQPTLTQMQNVSTKEQHHGPLGYCVGYDVTFATQSCPLYNTVMPVL